jgi:hypothetical protein
LEENTGEVHQILENAISEFYAKLPFTESALSEYIVHSLQTATSSHRKQSMSLDTIQEAVQRLAEGQRGIVDKLSYLDATVMVKESGRAEFRNPFRITKAEEFDHNYPLLAALFRKPANYDLIKGRDNLLLAGGRGCGKSMILRSLTASTAVRIQARNSQQNPARFADAGLDYFGVYIKLAKGYFDDCGPDAAVDQDMAIQLFQHVFNMQLLKAALDTVVECRREGILDISSAAERSIVEKIEALLGREGLELETFEHLKRVATNEEAAVRNYLGGIRIGLNPDYSGVFTYVNDFPKDFCRIILDEITELRGARIYFLLDEFENLAEFQQTVVNTITKLRPDSLTLKLATRSLGVKSRIDLQGEPIQSPRDYEMVQLDYDAHSKEYRDLLFEICEKRLEAESYNEKDIEKLLPPAEPYIELGEEVVSGIAKKMLEDKRKPGQSKLTEEDLNECVHKMGLAIIYRNRQGYKYPKIYAGAKDFATCSSGIISNFLELCKMAFYLAESSDQNVQDGIPIDIQTQNEAVYLVSKANIDWVPRNIPYTGPALFDLLLDLGDIFKGKLLYHMSEPEAARVAIKDPKQLEEAQYEEFVQILNDGLKWSVFQDTGAASAYLPKHKFDVRSSEFTLNRIFAPKLQISPRSRWRTNFSVEDLAGLCDPQLHSQKKKEIMKRVGAENKEHPLFDGTS